MIGVILERSGAAISMADALIRLIGSRFPNLTMSVIGYIVSIPVFCDSGYVILNSLRKAITARAGISALATSVALMTGLFATHNLVPPTPGPLAAASELGVTDQLGLVVGLGLVVAAVAAGAALIVASRLSHREFQRLPSDRDDDIEDLDYAALRESYGRLPHAVAAFMPIGVPLLLICIGSFVQLPGIDMVPGWLEGLLVFLGTPVIALLIGLLLAVTQLRGHGRLRTFNEQMTEAIRVSAPILLITGAGASFGAVLNEGPLTDFLADTLSGLGIGIAVPFLVAAALKTAQGSSTVAIITGSALVAPLLDSLGLGTSTGAVLAVLAVGSGAMLVSHANDSFFWVVSQLSRIPVATAYRTITVASAVQGLAAFATVWVLSLLLL